jgi:hypothetical protein
LKQFLMTPTELYKLWAPDDSLWSNWVKPVLFAEAAPVAIFSPPDWRSANVAWAPGVDAATAIILDLEEAFPVWMGMALAARGYRPVPLYNGASGPSAIVEVSRIAGALHAVARELADLPIARNAPPVFLLDAKRSGGGAVVGPGRFDNRWAVFPQDFPSANFLLAHGIRAVVLGQTTATTPQPDLAHVLLRWQEAGIQILSCDVQGQSNPEPVHINRPSNFRRLWYRALVLAGLRRNSAGGFGGIVPEPSQSGGYG